MSAYIYRTTDETCWCCLFVVMVKCVVWWRIVVRHKYKYLWNKFCM